MNLPNRITVGRLFATAGLFVLLELFCRHGGGSAVWYLIFIVYLGVVVCDGVDGYLARIRNEITAFGRIADPFADKIVISGVLVLGQSLPETEPLVPSWLVLLVLAREFLVTGLRAYLEGRGSDFGARWEGKAKMVVQAIYCGAVLFYPGSHFSLIRGFAIAMIYVTGAITVWSAISYVRKAREMLAAEK